MDIVAAAVFRGAVVPRSLFPSEIPRRTLATGLWIALLCWAAGVLWLSSLTPQQMPEAAFLFMDKINHFVAYAVGGWLAASALQVSRPLSGIGGSIALAVVTVAGFGVADEAVQAFTPGRTGGDVYDWIADLLGAAVGAGLSVLTRGRLNRMISDGTGPPARPQTG